MTKIFTVSNQHLTWGKWGSKSRAIGAHVVDKDRAVLIRRKLACWVRCRYLDMKIMNNYAVCSAAQNVGRSPELRFTPINSRIVLSRKLKHLAEEINLKECGQ